MKKRYDYERLKYSDPTMCACGSPGIRYLNEFACPRCISLESQIDELAGHTHENYVQKESSGATTPRPSRPSGARQGSIAHGPGSPIGNRIFKWEK